MNNTLLDNLERETNDTTTLNGDVAKKSTLNPLLNFFSQAGAMRGQDEKAVELFQFAYEKDPVYAIQLLFWLRDVRGGAGERQLFRTIFCYLLDHFNKMFRGRERRQLLKLVPDYGRWDDLTLLGELPDVRHIVQQQLREDLSSWHKDEPISLLAKWLPSISASNKKAKELAKIYAKGLQGEDSLEVPLSFEGTQKEYRQVLRALRGQINIVEHLMCHGRWDEIKFGRVPSQAARRLRKAFRKHQPTRYQEYLDLVESGEEKINAGAMFPSDLVLEYFRQGEGGYYYCDQQPFKADQTINAQWEALPKWGEEQDILIMADVSGSMTHPDMKPMAASTSLAMYTAERNTNPLWKNRFMTFSSQPEFIKLNSAMPLHTKLHKVMQSPWGMSTDLRKAMALVLNCCKKQSDLPDAIIVVSDMQFDPGSHDYGETSTYEDMKSMASELGFELPNIVWWNVASYGNSTCTFDENGVAMLSGYSPSNLQMAFDGKINPMQAMHTLVRDNPRYQPVREVFNL
jgi:hypothetical protein